MNSVFWCRREIPIGIFRHGLATMWQVRLFWPANSNNLVYHHSTKQHIQERLACRKDDRLRRKMYSERLRKTTEDTALSLFNLFVFLFFVFCQRLYFFWGAVTCVCCRLSVSISPSLAPQFGNLHPVSAITIVPPLYAHVAAYTKQSATPFYYVLFTILQFAHSHKQPTCRVGPEMLKHKHRIYIAAYILGIGYVLNGSITYNIHIENSSWWAAFMLSTSPNSVFGIPKPPSFVVLYIHVNADE